MYISRWGCAPTKKTWGGTILMLHETFFLKFWDPTQLQIRYLDEASHLSKLTRNRPNVRLLERRNPFLCWYEIPRRDLGILWDLSISGTVMISLTKRTAIHLGRSHHLPNGYVKENDVSAQVWETNVKGLAFLFWKVPVPIPHVCTMSVNHGRSCLALACKLETITSLKCDPCCWSRAPIVNQSLPWKVWLSYKSQWSSQKYGLS